MGREVFKFNEVDSNDFLRVNQSTITVQFHAVATYTTGAGSNTTTIPFAERGGFKDADGIYVGTTNATIDSGAATDGEGSGNIETASPITTFADNDSIILHTRGGSTQYATWYDDPDFVTGTAGTATLDENNEAVVFLKPGQYGVVFISSGTVLRADYHEVVEELDWVTVTPEHLSDTAGIGEAMRKLNPTTGGKVYIPPGTYNIDTEISFADLSGSAFSNVHIYGAGPGLTILKVPDSTGNIAGAVEGGIFDLGTVNNVTIEGMTIHGNQSDATNGAAGVDLYDGIFSEGSDDVTLRNLVITETRQGIHATTGTSNRWTIENCYINDVGGSGILLEDVNEAVIDKNRVITCGNDGIAVAGSSNANDNIIITKNYVDRSSAPTHIETGGEPAGSQVGALIKIENANNFDISHNQCIDNKTAGGAGIEADGVDVENGVIANNFVKYSGTHGIQVANNCVVNDNVVLLSGLDGIMVMSGGNASIDSVIIDGNLLKDCNEDNNTALQTAGTGVAGINIDPSNGTSSLKKCVINGNICHDDRGSGSEQMDYSLIVKADAGSVITNLIVTNNDFGATAGGNKQSASVRWVGVTASTVVSLRWRNNLTEDEYCAEDTLVNSTITVQNTNWPAHSGLIFPVFRTDNVSQNRTGNLDTSYDGTDTITITSRPGISFQITGGAEDDEFPSTSAGLTQNLEVPDSLQGAGFTTMLAPEASAVVACYFYVNVMTGGTSIDITLEDEDSLTLTDTVTVSTATATDTWVKLTGNGVGTTAGKALRALGSGAVGTVTALTVYPVIVVFGASDVSKVWWEFIGTTE